MSEMVITKSIRLAPREADELARVAQQTAITEAALMKKWILEGLRAQKLDRAIQAYMHSETDLRGGASMADISYNRFLREVQNRRIVVLEDPAFFERLDALAEAFDNEELRDAIRSIETTI
ncbi:MAG: hypothetical protein KKC71_00870 [Chloroflexi bacterium]|nr:hypothetical protein [Chloroflexota bacterium]